MMIRINLLGARGRPACLSTRQRGFTLIELIMVIVMLGVLAVFAAPRMFNRDDFYARGFHDETLALLRYAQKTAVAQRRMVCVTFDTTSNPNTVQLTMENPTPATTPMPAVNCSMNVIGPKGESPARVTARSGTTYSAATSFIFDGLGQPVGTNRVALIGNIPVQIANASNSITVEAATGYVHE